MAAAASASRPASALCRTGRGIDLICPTAPSIAALSRSIFTSRAEDKEPAPTHRSAPPNNTRKPSSFEPIVTYRSARSFFPIRKVPDDHTARPLPPQDHPHPRYRILHEAGSLSQTTQVWVRMDNLHPHTTKQDIARSLQEAETHVGRIMTMKLSGNAGTTPGTAAATVELDSPDNAEALLRSASEGRFTVKGVTPALRREVPKVLPPRVAANRVVSARPSRVLKIKVKTYMPGNRFTSVDHVLALLQAEGVDVETEWARVVRAPRNGELKMLIRFCCWRNQAAPALDVLREKTGLSVWYATDPCEAGLDNMVTSAKQPEAKMSRAPRSPSL